MIKEIQDYVNKVNELNDTALDIKFNGTDEEYANFVEEHETWNVNEFKRLMDKYGTDRLLKEMGFA